MIPDKLHDALNYLDDDLIEAADRQRNKINSKRLWLRIIPAAACLCIILTGITAARKQGVFEADSYVEKEQTLIDNIQDNSPIPPTESYIPDNSPNPNEDIKHEGLPAPEFAPEMSPETEDGEIPSFGIMIEEWSGDELYAVITEHTDTKILPIGTRVRVVFSDQCYVSKEEFPTGTRAIIQFYDYEKNDDDIILYSETIIKEE